MVDEYALPLLEPEFVGEGRRLVVDGLLALYDEVNATGTARWVSIEAPSGWGKTRIVREFYARLAAQRQHEPAYWPPTILGSLPERSDDVGARRKQVYPKVQHVPGSLPAYFWWGIAASLRNGVAADALAEDLRQLEDHQQYLDDVWSKLATWSERHQDWWKQPAGAVAEEGVTHVAGMALEAVAGAGVPGLGLVLPALQAIRSSSKRRRERLDRLQSEEMITGAPSDAVDQAVDLLTRLARPGLPVVIFVEDLHAADASLTELLSRCVNADSAILVITTSWPGHLERTEHIRTAVEAAGDRLTGLDHEMESAPAPFPPGASLSQLDRDDLGSLIRFYYPRVEEATAAALVRRYDNPLALELFCSIDKYRTRFADGHLRLPESEIAKLPKTIEDLYRSVWQDLPGTVRQALTIASLGVPVALDSTIGGHDLAWNTTLLTDTLATLEHPESEAIASALANASISASWSRRLSSTLSTFHERAQWQIAASDDEFLFDDEREQILDALALGVVDSLAQEDDDAIEPADLLYRARLALKLHHEQRLGSAPLGRAVLPALEALAAAPRDLGVRIELAAQVQGLLERGSTVWQQVQILHGSALVEAGHSDDAIPLLQEVVELVQRSDEVADPHTLLMLSNLGAAYAYADRHDEAVELLESIVGPAMELRPVGETVLLVMNNLGFAYNAAGRMESAAQVFSELLRLKEQMLGSTDPDTLHTRLQLAVVLHALGDLDRAGQLCATVLTDAGQTLGAESSTTLRARLALASVYESAGRLAEAIELHEGVRAATEQAFGAEHPLTFHAREQLASAYATAGRTEEALVELEGLVNDLTRTFDATHTQTLTARTNLAAACWDGGRHAAAVELFSDLFQDQLSVLGVDHPDTLRTWATMLDNSVTLGQAEAAIEPLRELLSDRIRVLGPDHPDTLASRNSLARAHEFAGQLQEAIAAYEEALSAATDAIGPQHPHTFGIRNNLAGAYESAGLVDMAIDLYEALIADAGQVLDADHPHLQTFRANLATVREAAGRPDGG